MGAQGGEIGEGEFVAEFFDEGEFQFGAVEVAGVIEEVGFDVDLRRGLGAGGAEADVEGGEVGGLAGVGEDGIDAVGGEDEAAGVEVGGGKSKLAADLVAGNDGAGEGVGAAEHLAGGIEVPGADGFPDAGAADGLAVEGDGGEVVNGEMEFGSQTVEERDVAPALMSKGELRPHADAVDVAAVADEGADEVLGGLFAEGAVEVEEEGGVQAEGFDGAEFLGQGVEERRDASGGDDGGGMGVEGDDDGERAVLAGVHQGLPEDLLVAEVDAIKRANGDADAARRGGKFAGAVEKFHPRGGIFNHGWTRMDTDGEGFKGGRVILGGQSVNHGGTRRNPARLSRKGVGVVVECGDLSPLFRGDLSPSN